MSAIVKLSGKLPGDDDTNGLDALADNLVRDPESIRVAVLWFDVAHITHDTDTGADVPTVRVRRLEPVTGADAGQLRTAGNRAHEQRTGRTALDLESVDVDDLFDDE